METYREVQLTSYLTELTDQWLTLFDKYGIVFHFDETLSVHEDASLKHVLINHFDICIYLSNLCIDRAFLLLLELLPL